MFVSKKGIIIYTIEEVNVSIVAHFHSGMNVVSSDTMGQYSIPTYRGKRVRKTIKRRQVMAREGDVTRVFLARASLHYDAARTALPFCRSCGDTVSRSRYSLSGAHQAVTCTGERIREDSALDGGQRGVPITPIPRESIFHATRGVTPITRATGMEAIALEGATSRLSSHHCPGNSKTTLEIDEII